MDNAARPRLMLGPGDLPALRTKVKRAPWREMWARLIADAERDDRAQPGTRAEGDYGHATAAQRCAFLYTVSGDDGWARKARAHVEPLLADPRWADRTQKGLTLYYTGKAVALAYDLCHGAPSWDAAFRAGLAAKLRAQADAVFEHGGAEQNTKSASNWQALRFSGAGLMYLTLDLPDAPADLDARIEECYRRVALYLRDNLGEAADAAGWNAEGLGYTYYAMGNGVCPFALALRRRRRDRDLRDACHAARRTLWTCYAALVKTRTGLWRPDFGDDNPGTDFEGTLGWAFDWCPPEILPGLRWWYDRTVGARGDRTYDHGRFGTISSLLCYPDPARTPEAGPMTLPAWRRLFLDTGGNGYFTWRNRYRDAGDVVAQVYVKRRGDRGHNGPDALSFRIVGLDALWAVGGGRYGPKVNGQDVYLRSMNTLYPSDPDGPLTISREAGKVVGTPPEARVDGGGHLVAAIDRSNVGVRGHVRRFVADFSARSGAEAVFIVCDTSEDGRLWQMCTLEPNRVQIDGPNAFLITGPTGNTLRGTVLYAAGPPALRTGTRPRGSKAGPYENNRFVLSDSADGCHLVVLTLARAGRPHPPVKAIGEWGARPRGMVTIGGLTVTFDVDNVRATY
jgi:hypothetical protein